nr:Rpn family recombination-promoting nuclease/putative transposase [Candidatus Wallbacteria bacterium]
MSQQIYGFLYDFVFKYVFGRQQNAVLLSYLLNALLDRPKDNKITVTEITNPFNLKEFAEDKFSIVDVKAKDEAGTLYTIEVQVLSHSMFVERALYYLSKLYSGQIKEGEKYSELRKTIGISIIDFELFDKEKEIHNIYKMLNLKSLEELTDTFELHFVELAKFKIDKPRLLQTRFEKWLHVLKFGDALYGGSQFLPDELKNEEGIIMAFEEMKKVNSDSTMRDIIEARAKASAAIATIKEDEFIKGKVKGMIEGKIEGKIEG